MARDIRLDVRERDDCAGTQFIWVVQATAPIENLFSSLPRSFHTRTEAVQDFDRVRGILGWKTTP